MRQQDIALFRAQDVAAFHRRSPGLHSHIRDFAVPEPRNGSAAAIRHDLTDRIAVHQQAVQIIVDEAVNALSGQPHRDIPQEGIEPRLRRSVRAFDLKRPDQPDQLGNGCIHDRHRASDLLKEGIAVKLHRPKLQRIPRRRLHGRQCGLAIVLFASSEFHEITSPHSSPQSSRSPVPALSRRNTGCHPSRDRAPF